MTWLRSTHSRAPDVERPRYGDARPQRASPRRNQHAGGPDHLLPTAEGWSLARAISPGDNRSHNWVQELHEDLAHLSEVPAVTATVLGIRLPTSIASTATTTQLVPPLKNSCFDIERRSTAVEAHARGNAEVVCGGQVGHDSRRLVLLEFLAFVLAKSEFVGVERVVRGINALSR
ncbi:hypothetical protein CERZMDRAFT_88097 [Cercospora zeae-maydis SCOH1-5]|uniref:Uncharacterized protein n=1 Tax=Cercospora zeae-maydis SCOH1-5 TaxID=717836 RepID=A0A6A6F242_9PEZI|nr:hypothetical protein CERZMDRAFT_88097 [Cercospora zeae-maydis SCOH1-5]